jgi:hypothetical protein
LKPLVRWTAGAIRGEGVAALWESVRKFTRFYGDRFDYVICHNNLNPEAHAAVHALGLPTHPQDGHCLPFRAEGVAWKLYPPRLRPDAHEILIDSDLVVTHPLPDIEWFLREDDLCVVTEGLFRSYGTYAHMVPEDKKINTGLVGWPPGFDLEAAVRQHMASNPNGRWADKFDEQGMLAAIITNRHHQVIPMSRVGVCHDGSLPAATHGYHFVELNSGRTEAWYKYRSRSLKMV